MRLGVTAVATASTSSSSLSSSSSAAASASTAAAAASTSRRRRRHPQRQSTPSLLFSRASGMQTSLVSSSAPCRTRRKSVMVSAARSNSSSSSSSSSKPSSSSSLSSSSPKPDQQAPPSTDFEARSRVGRPAPVRQEFLDACAKIGMPHPSAWLFDPETGLALIRKRLTYSELLRDVRLGRVRSVALFDSEHKLYDAFETDFYGEDGRTPPTEDGAAIVQYREGYVDGDDASDANVVSEDDPAVYSPLPKKTSSSTGGELEEDDLLGSSPEGDFVPGILATATVPPHDARLAAAFEAHGVTVGRLPSPGDEASILLRKPAVPSPARARFFKALPYLFILGAYLATQVAAWMKGDYLDRAALRKADIAKEKAQAEQARRDEARLELEELAASGYSADAILAEARRVGRPAKEAYVRALVEAAKEGKAGNTAAAAEDDDKKKKTTTAGGEREFAGDAQQYAEALRAAALAKLAKMAGGSDSAEAGEVQIGKLSTVQIQAAGGGDAARAEADAAIWDDDASGAALRAAQRKLKGVKLQYIGSGRVLFSDVAGVEGAKRELAEVVDFFTKPQKFRASGARVPRGVLLVGPPGTGKTLLARAVAGEAGVSFLSLNASEFVEMFVGVGASRVRDLFAQARSMAPAVIFIDEIDAVGRKRGGAQGNDERDATLNQLLTEMDGFTTEQDVVVIGATNRVDVLDDALTRPGRFDRIATVEEADAAGRVAILKLHLGWEEGEGGDNRSDGRAKEEFVLDDDGRPTKVRAPRHRRCDDSVNLKRLADDTLGFSGAALAALVNDAALRAARDGRDAISMEDLEESLEEDLMGPLRAPFDDARGPRIALVEATAAVAAVLLSPPLERLVEVTVRPRDKWPYGQTVLEADDDREGANLYTRKYLLAQLVESLAPYAAERLFRGPDAQSMLASRRLATGRRVVDRMVAGAGIAQGGFSVLGEKDDFLREIAGRDAPFPRRRSKEEEGGGDVFSDARSRLLGGEWRTVAVPAWFGGRSLAQAVPSRVSRATQAAAAADAQALFEEGLAAADALVERNRDAIEAVASALLEKQILDGDEVRRIVELKGDAEDVARTQRERGVFY